MRALVPARIVRRIAALARSGAPGATRLARDYAAAYGAPWPPAPVEASAPAPAPVEASAPAPAPLPTHEIPAPIDGAAILLRLASDLAAPRARRAQILRRLRRLDAAASIEATAEGFRILPSGDAEALRARLASNAEVAAARLAAPDTRVG